MDFLHRTWAEISIPALIHNFNIIKQHCTNTKIIAVVKANAYGHSAKEISAVLDREGAYGFAVSNITEALKLREYGINKPILILGYTPAEYAKTLSENNITQAVYSTEYAKSLSKFACESNTTVSVHIKLDTGMGRLGFDIRNENSEELDAAISVYSLSNLKITGTFMHFPVADSSANNDKEFTNLQYKRFYNAVQAIQSKGYDTGILHCSNSAGVISGSKFKLDACRPGIILYGLNPSNEVTLNGLIPVMTVKSVISMIKTIRKGETVSYGRTFTAKNNMKIATVTAGYADGYPRLLSNNGEVIIRKTRVPIVGRICMDQFMVDVTSISDVTVGDEVELFGSGISADEIAKKCNTINYEIICGLSDRVPRIIKY